METIYQMSVRKVMFLARVNGRLKEIEALVDMQSQIASNGRQMDEMGFSTFTNKLRYG